MCRARYAYMSAASKSTPTAQPVPHLNAEEALAARCFLHMVAGTTGVCNGPNTPRVRLAGVGCRSSILPIVRIY